MWLLGTSIVLTLALTGVARPAALRISEAETIRLVSQPERERFVDVGRSGFSPGDSFVFLDSLMNETKSLQVGTLLGHCTIHFEGRGVCEATLRLRDRGQITATGALNLSEQSRGGTVAITGGTGDFQNVRGQAQVRFLDEDAELITLELIP